MGGGSSRKLEEGSTDNGDFDRIVLLGEKYRPVKNLPMASLEAPSDCDFLPEKKPQHQEEKIAKGKQSQQHLGSTSHGKIKKNTSYTSLVSMAIDDFSCSSSECDSHPLHEEEQALESVAEDDLHMPNPANYGVAGQSDSDYGDDGDNDDDSSQCSFSSGSSTNSASKTPIHDPVIFDETGSNIITVESRSACAGQNEKTLVCADTNTLVEKKGVPPSCIKYELSSMAVFDQLVVQRSCLGTIIRSIRNFPGTDAAMQEWVCNALARWSCDELNRRLIVQNGGFEIVLSSMTRHPTVASVQIQGCRALGNLCYGSRENSIFCRAQGGVSVILHAMKTCHVIEDVFIKACYALSVVLRNDPKAIDHLKGFEMVDIIVERMIMNNQNAAIQRLGCAVMWHLVPDFGAVPNSSYTIAEIVKIVLKYSLLCHIDDKNVQKYALGLLTKSVGFDSSEDKRSLLELYEATNCIILSMKIHASDPYIMEDGCFLLLSFMEHFDKQKVLSIVVTLKFECVLIDSIWAHRDSPQVVERILAVLAALAGHCYEYAHCISSVQGSLSAIVSVMMANANNNNLQYQACKCLSRLSRHKDLQASIGSAGGIYAIVDAMRSHPQDVDIQVHSISALEDLVRIDYNAKMIYLSGGIPVVERAGNIYPEFCKKPAIKIVRMTNKANCSANRRKGGPLLRIINCCSSLTASFQNNLFHQKNIHVRCQSEHEVSVKEAEDQEKSRDIPPQNEGEPSSMMRRREKHKKEVFPIDLFDSMKRWFNEDCEDSSLEGKSEPDLVFY